MARASEWISALRPRTLPASLAPVLAGTGAAAQLQGARPWLAALAGVVALALQIGVNFANDYSDGVRGTDLGRQGPQRLVGSGAASPGAVKAAAFAAFGLAAIAGLALVVASRAWWLLALGALAIVAAWFYTGGKKPYGYLGLGDVAVFAFFGLLAVLGTTYTQAQRLSLASVLAAAGVGLLACALLMANNVRDIAGDERAGKRTLAVRLGDSYSRILFGGELALALMCAAACAYTGWLPLLVAILLTPWAVVLLMRALKARTVPEHVAVLKGTGLFELAYGLALGLALIPWGSLGQVP